MDARYVETGMDTEEYRGLHICRKTGRKINADIDAMLNIARSPGHRIEITKKI